MSRRLLLRLRLTSAALPSRTCTAEIAPRDRSTIPFAMLSPSWPTCISPATPASAARLLKLGEDPWRIHRCGSPGIDGIRAAAASRHWVRQQIELPFALVVLHPVDVNPSLEKRRAVSVVRAVEQSGIPRIVIVYPNNDPGSAGIIDAWKAAETTHTTIFKDLPRPMFLGLLRDAAVLVGNSSSGIIEAASFGTPVVDIGPRQAGREHGANVAHVGYSEADIRKVLVKIWNKGRPGAIQVR